MGVFNKATGAMFAVIGFGLAGLQTAQATPISATVTTAYSCSGGTCSYAATLTNLTDFQVQFNLPQFGSAGTPAGAVLSSMSFSLGGSFVTTGTLTAGANGVQNATATTDSLLSSGAPQNLILAPANFFSLAGSNAGDGNLTYSSEKIATSTIGNLAAFQTSPTFTTTANFAGLNNNFIDNSLIGNSTLAYVLGTGTFTSNGQTGGNSVEAQSTSETVNVNLSYNYSIPCGGQGNPCPTPEPASMSLLGFGLVGLAVFVRRRRVG